MITRIVSFFLIVLCVSSLSAQEATELSKAFRGAAERVLPATVKIIARIQTAEVRRAMEVQVPALRQERGRRQPGDSAGTGVLIDPKGIILTNNHVVQNAREIEVELPDGRHYYGKKFRHDTETDLAVVWLDIDPDDKLPFAVFGDSDAMEIGDWVLAIGNPFEMDSSVSAGIISAKGRILPKIQRTELLQTDAAINPGNSGGPLINLAGEVIGINTVIKTETGANQGIGFALPSNNARWVAEQIIEKDVVQRSWLGLQTYALTVWEAKRLGVAHGAGVVVDYTIQNSPAEGVFQEDDVILSFDGQPVNAVFQLQRLTERAALDKEHDIIFIREGKRYKVAVDVKPLPRSAGPVVTSADQVVQSYVDNQLGIHVIQGTDGILKPLRLGKRKGMVALTVFPEGRAARAGVAEGMLIVKIDGREIRDRRDYMAAKDASSLSNGITLDVVLPGGSEQKITIRLGQ